MPWHIFNLFLVVVTLVLRLFNLKRLQVKTKTSEELIFDLQYANDAAFPNHTSHVLQPSLDVVSNTYHQGGLLINTKKTEILPNVSPTDALIFTVNSIPLKNISSFT